MTHDEATGEISAWIEAAVQLHVGECRETRSTLSIPCADGRTGIGIGSTQLTGNQQTASYCYKILCKWRFMKQEGRLPASAPGCERLRRVDSNVPPREASSAISTIQRVCRHGSLRNMMPQSTTSAGRVDAAEHRSATSSWKHLHAQQVPCVPVRAFLVWGRACDGELVPCHCTTVTAVPVH